MYVLDFHKVKTALQMAFSSDPIAAYEELQQRTLQPGESVAVYFADLTRIVKLVDSRICDKYIKCAFIAGLPSEMKKQLKAACKLNTMSLSEVVDRARTLAKSDENVCFAAIKSPDRRRCYRCGQEGHMSRWCPSIAKNDQTPRNVKCFGCSYSGHVVKDCPNKFQRRRCYVCGDACHLAPACPLKFQQSKNE